MAINLTDKLTAKTVEGILVDSKEVFYNDAMGVLSSGDTVAAKLYEIDRNCVRFSDLDTNESGGTTNVTNADFAVTAMKDGNGNILSEMSALAINAVQHEDLSDYVSDIDATFQNTFEVNEGIRQTTFEANEATRNAANQSVLNLNASLSGLTTSAKTSIVDAINEINAKPSGSGNFTDEEKAKLAELDITVNGNCSTEDEEAEGTVPSDPYISNIDIELASTNYISKQVYNNPSSPLAAGTYIFELTEGTAVIDTTKNWGIECKNGSGTTVYKTTGAYFPCVHEFTISEPATIIGFFTNQNPSAVLTPGTVNVKLYEKGATDIVEDTTIKTIGLVNKVNNLKDTVSGNTINIGSLSGLTTSAKTSLVDAINEVNAKRTLPSGGSGDTANSAIYLTEDKSLQEQIIYEDTTYVIQYDHKIDDELTIPKNCILDFAGGSIVGTTYIDGVETDNYDAVTTYQDIELDNKASSGYSASISVNEGDRFLITGEAISGTPLCTFVNTSGGVVSATTESKLYREVITAPASGTMNFSSTPYVGRVRKVTQVVTHAGNVVFDNTEIRNSNFKNITSNSGFTFVSNETVELDKLPFYNEWYNPKECVEMFQTVFDWCKDNNVGKIIFPHGKEYLICLNDYDGVSFINSKEVKRAIVIEDCNIDFNNSTLQLEVNRSVNNNILVVNGICKIENGTIRGDQKEKDSTDPDSFVINSKGERYYITNEFNYACVCHGEKCLFDNMTFEYVHGDGIFLVSMNDQRLAYHKTKAKMVDEEGNLVDSNEWSVTVNSSSDDSPIAFNLDVLNYKYIIPKMSYIHPKNAKGESTNVMVSPANCPINFKYRIASYHKNSNTGEYEFIEKKEYTLGDIVYFNPNTTHIYFEYQTRDRTSYLIDNTWWLCYTNGGFYNKIDNCNVRYCGRNGIVVSGQHFLTISNSEITHFGGTNNELGIDIENDEYFEFLNANVIFENLLIGNTVSNDIGNGCINLGCVVNGIVRNCTLLATQQAIGGWSYGNIIENVTATGTIILNTPKDCQMPNAIVRNTTAYSIAVGRGVIEDCILTGGIGGDNTTSNNLLYESTYRRCTVYTKCGGTWSWAKLTEDCIFHVEDEDLKRMDFFRGEYRGCTFNLPCLTSNFGTDFENCTFNVKHAYTAQSLESTICVKNKFIGNTINGVFAANHVYRFKMYVSGEGVVEISDNNFIYPSGWTTGTLSDMLHFSNKNLKYVYFKNNTFDFSNTTSASTTTLLYAKSSYDNDIVMYVEGIGVKNFAVNNLFGGYYGSQSPNITLYIKDVDALQGARREFNKVYIWKNDKYVVEGEEKIINLDSDTELQDQMVYSGVTYVVQENHTLDKQLTIPANCTLDFRGGSLNSKTILAETNTLSQDVFRFDGNYTSGGTWTPYYEIANKREMTQSELESSRIESGNTNPLNLATIRGGIKIPEVGSFKINTDDSVTVNGILFYKTSPSWWSTKSINSNLYDSTIANVYLSRYDEGEEPDVTTGRIIPPDANYFRINIQVGDDDSVYGKPNYNNAISIVTSGDTVLEYEELEVTKSVNKTEALKSELFRFDGNYNPSGTWSAHYGIAYSTEMTQTQLEDNNAPLNLATVKGGIELPQNGTIKINTKDGVTINGILFYETSPKWWSAGAINTNSYNNSINGLELSRYAEGEEPNTTTGKIIPPNANYFRINLQIGSDATVYGRTLYNDSVSITTIATDNIDTIYYPLTNFQYVSTSGNTIGDVKENTVFSRCQEVTMTSGVKYNISGKGYNNKPFCTVTDASYNVIETIDSANYLVYTAEQDGHLIFNSVNTGENRPYIASGNTNAWTDLTNMRKGIYSIKDGALKLEETVTLGCTTTIPVTREERFVVTGTGGADGRLYAFADANGNIISKADANAKMYNELITVPSGATQFIFNSEPFTARIRKVKKLGNTYGSVVFNNTTIINPNFNNLDTNSSFKFVDKSDVEMEKLPFYNHSLLPKKNAAMINQAISWCNDNGIKLLRFPQGKHFEVTFANYDGTSYNNGKTTQFIGFDVSNLDIDLNKSTIEVEVNRLLSYTCFKLSENTTLYGGCVSGDLEYKECIDPLYGGDLVSGNKYTTSAFYENNYCTHLYGSDAHLKDMTICNTHGDAICGVSDLGWNLDKPIANFTNGIVDGEGNIDTTQPLYNVSDTLNVEHLKDCNTIIVKLYKHNGQFTTMKTIPVNIKGKLIHYDKVGNYIGTGDFVIGNPITIPEECKLVRIVCQGIDGKPYDKPMVWTISGRNHGSNCSVEDSVISNAGRNAFHGSCINNFTFKNVLVKSYGGTNNNIGFDFETDDGGDFLSSNILFDNVRVVSRYNTFIGGDVNLATAMYTTFRNCNFISDIYSDHGSCGLVLENTTCDLKIAKNEGYQFPNAKIDNCVFGEVAVPNGIVNNSVVNSYSHNPRMNGMVFNNSFFYINTDGVSIMGNNGVEFNKCTFHAENGTIGLDGYDAPCKYIDCNFYLKHLPRFQNPAKGSDYDNCNFTIQDGYYQTHFRINKYLKNCIFDGLTTKLADSAGFKIIAQGKSVYIEDNQFNIASDSSDKPFQITTADNTNKYIYLTDNTINAQNVENANSSTNPIFTISGNGNNTVKIDGLEYNRSSSTAKRPAFNITNCAMVMKKDISTNIYDSAVVTTTGIDKEVTWDETSWSGTIGG